MWSHLLSEKLGFSLFACLGENRELQYQLIFSPCFDALSSIDCLSLLQWFRRVLERGTPVALKSNGPKKKCFPIQLWAKLRKLEDRAIHHGMLWYSSCFAQSGKSACNRRIEKEGASLCELLWIWAVFTCFSRDWSRHYHWHVLRPPGTELFFGIARVISWGIRQ